MQFKGLLLLLVLLHSLHLLLSHQPTIDLIDKQIATLKNTLLLPSTKNSFNDQESLFNADVWRRIGVYTQMKAFRQHIGGEQLKRETLDAFDLALSLDRNRTVSLNVHVLYLKGIILKHMGLGDESIKAFDTALSYAPNNMDQSSLMYHKAGTLVFQGKLVDAVNLYRETIQRLPCRVDRYYSYVKALKEQKNATSDWLGILNEIQDAVERCTTMTHATGATENVFVMNDLGDAKILDIIDEDEDEDDEDDEEEAETETEGYSLYDEFYDEGKPRLDGAITSQLAAQKSKFLPQGETELSSYLLDGEDPVSFANTVAYDRGSSEVFWALHVAAEEAGRISLAWWYLEKANKMEKARRPPFRAEDTTNQQMQIESVFTATFWDTLPNIDHMRTSNFPIFIVGMMRSGSTLLETMLDAHKNIYGMGEDSMFNGNLSAFRDELVTASSGGDGATWQEVKRVVEGYNKMTTDRMKHAARNVLEKKKYKKLKHVVDKMVFNFKNIGFIHLVFPTAVILHTVRDPLDTVFSCFRHKFDDTGLEWAMDLQDLALQYNSYLEIMHHFSTVLKGRVIDVRYEALVTHPEATMRDIIENKLRLQWDPEVLNFYLKNRSVHTHSMSQVRHPVNSKAIGSWRRYAKQLAPLREELGKYLNRLKGKSALPFMHEMNWLLDPAYDYTNIAATAKL